MGVPPDQAEHWIRLIELCPWSAPGSSEPSAQAEPDARTPKSEPTAPSAPVRPADADRFAWVIRANVPEAEFEEELTEADVTGPWRELVDAVRASAR